ncbi:MAG: hypothetical protein N2044_03425 [Cyclobacteriaceae bacterium]|nr:hypothetical protein [Cyclobacteriaceae bacterium]
MQVLRSRYIPLVLLWICFNGLCQNPEKPKRTYMETKYTLERLARLGSDDPTALGTVQSLPMPPPDVKGSDLLNPGYNASTFLLNDSSLLNNLPAKYYVLRNEFDVKTPQGIRTLKGDRVKSFMWVDSASKKTEFFVNMKEYQGANGSPGSGFMQILSEGKITLLKQTEVIFKKANYHVAMHVGSPDHEFIRKTHLYYLTGKTFQPLPGKKKLLTVFPDHQDELQRFIKVNQLDLNLEHHIQILVDYYNSLK